MAMLPFSEVERRTVIKTILSSRDILGGRYSAAVAFSTVPNSENPNVLAAIADVFDEAMDLTLPHPEEAGQIYNKHEPQKTGVEVDHQDDGSERAGLTAVQLVAAFEAFADFMYKSGMLKNKANSWKDFFERAWSKSG